MSIENLSNEKFIQLMKSFENYKKEIYSCAETSEDILYFVENNMQRYIKYLYDLIYFYISER
jgi:hypothetical protein